MTSIEAVKKLGILKQFPATEDQLLQLIEAIDNYVPGKKIKYLVAEILSAYDYWPGPATFLAICKSYSGQQRGDLKDWDQGRLPALHLCNKCESWGHLSKDGFHVRCDCTAGQTLDQEYLDLVNAIPGRSATKLQRFTIAETRKAGVR